MFDLVVFVTLLTLGYGFGRLAEKGHYKSIIRRERKLSRLPAVPTKIPPLDKSYDAALVSGNVVVSVDYFKVFVAGLRNLVGGRISAYETLLDRARREAILRMKEDASAKGAAYVFNVKLETSRISQNTKKGPGSVEVLAYGTALMPR